jgi:hypothetical protein
MTGCNSRCRNFRRNRKAASPAVSMVIITAATVVLVLVSGSYAWQVLDRQKASAEFDTVTKSLVTFDDAVRDIAWDRGGSRSVRFTTNYGNIALLPNNKTLNIKVLEPEYSSFNYDILTGVVKYSIPTSYVTFGDGYESYILGSESAVVSSITESYAQLLAAQQLGSLNVTLNYRVRVTEEGPPTVANYIDILVIRMNCTNLQYLTGDFDLVARNVAITTISKQFNNGGSTATISVSLDGVQSEPVQVALDQSLPTVFNLIVADVKVSS